MRFLHNRRFWQLVLGAMLIPLALIAFWPSPVDEPVQGQLADILTFLHRHGIPGWVNYKFVEASANVALFLPIGFASTLAFPSRPWRHIGLLGLLISGCMEVGQLLFLHNRFSTPADLMTNTSGAVIGALVAALMVRKEEARRLSAADL